MKAFLFQSKLKLISRPNVWGFFFGLVLVWFALGSFAVQLNTFNLWGF